MNRLLALLAVGFLGLSLTGCGGGGDMVPEGVPAPSTGPTPEEIEYEKQTDKS